MPARRLPHAHRPAAAIIAMLAFLLAFTAAAPSASADPARPTNLESEVVAVDGGGADGVEVRILGGDAFIEVRVTTGRTAEIPGYEDEPYLRIAADGRVERNRRSPTAHLNESRDGGAPLPADASTTAEPVWEHVGANGVVAFHDHRIHWMGGGRPPVGADGVVQEWTVPLTVDGDEVRISGVLRYEPDVSPLPWVALALLTGLGTWFLSVTGRQVALLAAAVVAGVVAISAYLANPPGAEPVPVAVILTGIALVLAVIAPFRKDPTAAIGAVAALLGWVGLRATVLIRPVVPTVLPMWTDRAATAIVAGVAIAVAARIVLSRPIEPTPTPA